MKNRLLTFAGALALLAVLGKFYAPPLMAQVRAALVQDVDQPGRSPFTAVASININNFTSTNVPIPTGKRLVIDHVSISGAAGGGSGPVQPVIVIGASAAGSGASYYVAPDQSATVANEWYKSEQATIYADTLSVSPAYAGNTPSFMIFNVIISGHLISIP